MHYYLGSSRGIAEAEWLVDVKYLELLRAPNRPQRGCPNTYLPSSPSRSSRTTEEPRTGRGNIAAVVVVIGQVVILFSAVDGKGVG